MSDVDPDFNEPIKNVTVPVGREAVLSCMVTELGHYKVKLYFMYTNTYAAFRCPNDTHSYSSIVHLAHV
jgi:hypothetical protein